MHDARRILSELDSHCEHTIGGLIRLRTETHGSEGLSPAQARKVAADEVLADVERLYASGGAEAVRNFYGCPS